MPEKKWIALIIGLVMLLIAVASLDQGTPWDGVDTAVVGKYASELGRKPQQPFLNLQGDSLLFAFAISAAFGGFIAGYFWRELFGGGNTNTAGNDRDRRVPPREAKRDV